MNLVKEERTKEDNGWCWYSICSMQFNGYNIRRYVYTHVYEGYHVVPACVDHSSKEPPPPSFESLLLDDPCAWQSASRSRSNILYYRSWRFALVPLSLSFTQFSVRAWERAKRRTEGSGVWVERGKKRPLIALLLNRIVEKSEDLGVGRPRTNRQWWIVYRFCHDVRVVSHNTSSNRFTGKKFKSREFNATVFQSCRRQRHHRLRHVRCRYSWTRTIL